MIVINYKSKFMSGLANTVIVSNYPVDWNLNSVIEFLASAGEIKQSSLKGNSVLITFNDDEGVENSLAFDGVNGIQIAKYEEQEGILVNNLVENNAQLEENQENQEDIEYSEKGCDEKKSSKKFSFTSEPIDIKEIEEVMKEEILQNEDKNLINESDEQKIQQDAKDLANLDQFDPYNTPQNEPNISPRKVLSNSDSYEKIIKDTDDYAKNIRCDLATGVCYRLTEAEMLERSNVSFKKPISQNNVLHKVVQKEFIERFLIFWAVLFIISNLFIK